MKHYWRTAIEVKVRVKVRVGRLEAAACVGEKRGEPQGRRSTVDKRIVDVAEHDEEFRHRADPSLKSIGIFMMSH